MADQGWTVTQRERLRELGVDVEQLALDFPSSAEKNTLFQQLEKQQIKRLKGQLDTLFLHTRKPQMQSLREQLCTALSEQGFTRVFTPIVMNRKALLKMTIDESHPLNGQVYWLNEKQCLRPMLAPNLYSLMQDFERMKRKNTRFFEIGSCFRKESRGANHSSEFTMLNLVEMGLPLEERQTRLEELAGVVMKAAGVEGYCFLCEESEVYGATIDVVTTAGQLELASGAMGPHSLDAAWGVTGTWVGLGVGLERLLMTVNGDTSIGKWSKSLHFIDGVSLKL